MFSSQLSAQDLILYYETVPGVGTTEVRLHMANMTGLPMDIGSVNLSVVFQNNCGTYQGSNSDFETTWGSILEYDQANPTTQTYSGLAFNQRVQYGNTNSDAFNPVGVPIAPNPQASQLVMTMSFQTGCNLNYYVESLSENPFNEITDLNGNAISYTIQPLAGGSLPIEWLDFQAWRYGPKEAILEWTTGEEQNNSHFEIERSVDNLVFTRVGEVAAKSQIQEINQYSFLDQDLNSGIWYYRIRQVDHSGNTSYSETRMVNMTGGDTWSFELLPNPASETTKITLRSEKEDYFIIRLFDMLGKEIQRQELPLIDGAQVEINLTQLPEGLYHLELIKQSDGTHITRQLVRR
ncbi:MAG: T9SS type A sorting domain-containing protein [Bacteroidia bacterium]